MASKVVKQLAGNGAGQSLADRVNAAKYSLAGSGIGRGIIKATTEELVPPKKKHLDYLVSCTNEVNVSIPEVAELLLDRTLQVSWVVVLKSFITTHHLLNFGNEKFSQYMAAKQNKIDLPNFVDKTSSIGYEMSQYIKVYSKYINEKTVAYRMMAFDFCKIKRGRDDGVLRRMPLDKLMKTLPVLQSQIDALLEFDATVKDLNNPVLCNAFTLLYKDLIRLYASYNEGMINLIERYFTMSRKMCREALALYKGFLERTETVNKFVTVAENTGVGDRATLGLQAVPPKVLQTLENHLANLEKRKKSESDDDDEKQQHKLDKVNPKIKADITVAAEKAAAIASNTAKKQQQHQKQKDLLRTQEADSQKERPTSTPVYGNTKVSQGQGENGGLNNLENLLNSSSSTNVNTSEDKSDTNAPVRTQLRRPEQQHSVAVTVKRTERRSPSPSRPPRPTNAPSRSRDASPARPVSGPVKKEHHKKDNDVSDDLFLGLRNDENSNLDLKNSPNNDGRVSPFAADEKPLDQSGSFWATETGSDNHNDDINFEAAFKEDVQNKADNTGGETSNLFELDLLGLDSEPTPKSADTNETAAKPTPQQQIPDLDDLFNLGNKDDGVDAGAVLSPQAVSTPIVPLTATPLTPSSTQEQIKEDDLLGALAVGMSKSNSDTSAIKPTAAAASSSSNPAHKTQPASSGLDDTLAALAQSLGKTENKWSSSQKPPTLAGKTLGTIEPSSGSTINWSNKNTSSNKEADSGSGDVLDLLG